MIQEYYPPPDRVLKGFCLILPSHRPRHHERFLFWDEKVTTFLESKLESRLFFCVVGFLVTFLRSISSLFFFEWFDIQVQFLFFFVFFCLVIRVIVSVVFGGTLSNPLFLTVVDLARKSPKDTSGPTYWEYPIFVYVN